MNAHQTLKGRPRPTWLVAATLLIVSVTGALVVTSRSKDDGASPSNTKSTQTPALEREEFPQPVLLALHEALSSYEKARSSLAYDRLDEIRAPATGVASSLEEAETGSAVSLTTRASYPCRVSPRRDVAWRGAGSGRSA